MQNTQFSLFLPILPMNMSLKEKSHQEKQKLQNFNLHYSNKEEFILGELNVFSFKDLKQLFFLFVYRKQKITKNEMFTNLFSKG